MPVKRRWPLSHGLNLRGNRSHPRAVSELITRSTERPLVTGLILFLAALFGADHNGEVTVLVPVLVFAAFVGALTASFRKRIDSQAWRFFALSAFLVATSYSLVGLGFTYRDPLIIVMFALSYPAILFGGYQLLRVRVIIRLAGFWMDGVAAAVVGSTLLFAMYRRLPGASQVRSPSDFFAVAIFPMLDLLLLSILVMVLAMMQWRVPRQVKLLAASQLCLALADCLWAAEEWGTPLVPGVSARLNVVSYACIVLARFSRERWSLSTEVWKRPRGILAIAWATTAAVITLLLLPEINRWERLGVGVGIGLVVLRLTIAYRESHVAHDLRVEARTDELTGLPNRRAFNEGLAGAILHGQRFSVLMLDLDRFKEVNDSMGHDVGDQVLCVTTARLQRIALNYPAQLFRLGGDEFACVMSDPQRVVELGQAIREIVSEPIFLYGQRIDQHVSIGVSNFPTDAEHPSDLLRLADVAMYRAKHGRTGLEVFTAQEASMSSLHVHAALHEALENDSFSLHYQPQIKFDTKTVHGVEALLRVQHGNQLIPTPLVISAAESAGKMEELTHAVINRAAKDMARLARLGFDITMSVNVSAADLSSPRFIPHLVSTIKRNGIKPARFTIEVTEESLLLDVQVSSATVSTLRSLGFGVSMDDFGIGFSSLTNLRLLAVSELKIDRSFVEGLSEDRRTEALVRSMVHLGEQLDAHVLIEGVESADDAIRAAAYGVELAQGYLFSRPIPFDDLVKWLGGTSPQTITALMDPVTV